MRHVETERQRLAEARGLIRIEPADDFLIPESQDRMRLGARRLEDFNGGFRRRERGLLRLERIAVAEQVFGADAEDDLAVPGARHGRLGKRKRRCLAAAHPDRDRRQWRRLS